MEEVQHSAVTADTHRKLVIHLPTTIGWCLVIIVWPVIPTSLLSCYITEPETRPTLPRLTNPHEQERNNSTAIINSIVYI